MKRILTISFILLALLASMLPGYSASADNSAGGQPGKMPAGMGWQSQLTSDQAAVLDNMAGEWDGTGTSTFGPYFVHMSNRRVGDWLVTAADIMDQQGGTVFEHAAAVYGYVEGKLMCYNFDSLGAVEFAGSGDARNGKFRWEQGDAWREFTWQVNDDGTVTSSYMTHLPGAPPPFNDFTATDTDHRVK